MKYLYAGLALLALLLCAVAIGYAWHGNRDDAKLTAEKDARTQTKTDLALCVDASKGTSANLDDVRTQLADLKRRHEAALDAASKALDSRDAQIASLLEEARTRSLTTRKNAHEDPDCRALAALAVCASVADRLWPVPAEASTAAGGHPH